MWRLLEKCISFLLVLLVSPAIGAVETPAYSLPDLKGWDMAVGAVGADVVYNRMYGDGAQATVIGMTLAFHVEPRYQAKFLKDTFKGLKDRQAQLLGSVTIQGKENFEAAKYEVVINGTRFRGVNAISSGKTKSVMFNFLAPVRLYDENFPSFKQGLEQLVFKK